MISQSTCTFYQTSVNNSWTSNTGLLRTVPFLRRSLTPSGNVFFLALLSVSSCYKDVYLMRHYENTVWCGYSCNKAQLWPHQNTYLLNANHKSSQSTYIIGLRLYNIILWKETQQIKRWTLRNNLATVWRKKQPKSSTAGGSGRTVICLTQLGQGKKKIRVCSEENQI